MTDGIRAGSLSASFSAPFEAEDAGLLARYATGRQSATRTVTLTPASSGLVCPQCGEPAEDVAVEGCELRSPPPPEHPDSVDHGAFRVNMAGAVVRALPCGCVLAADPVQALRAMGATVEESLLEAEESDE